MKLFLPILQHGLVSLVSLPSNLIWVEECIKMVDDRYYDVALNCIPNEQSMVAIRDDKDYSVFPPINHENLNLHLFSNHQHHNPRLQSSSSSSPSSSSLSSDSFSTSDCDIDTWGYSSPLDSQVRKGGDFFEWLSIGLQILRTKLLAFRNRNRSPDRGAIWSFGIPFAAVVIVMVMMRRRKKNRRRNLTPSETRLINIIKEKDGRIAQLLHQIAQMNEILIERHKALAAKVVQ